MSRVIKLKFSTETCPPIKKPGKGEFFVPLFFLYFKYALPVRNNASLGISKTFILSAEIAFSTSSIFLNPIETSV
ncbi:MAG: hypothetical protein L3J24_04445 [Xanthomonadales bacterium]|nr:hypothetical protein [Xanthomonadales bacterium]